MNLMFKLNIRLNFNVFKIIDISNPSNAVKYYYNFPIICLLSSGIGTAVGITYANYYMGIFQNCIFVTA